ncbi:MAG TPA: RagB/SusD family nutrient uptake outer membrane protein [Chitinophaga sp.]|uniref:RagB/SusD family nutrient uptake outer membrane protein n=1 Tax=Chitinophaga sp. TaxID=1869181 RepID=UPI002DBE42B8|nr:RagB/SusD family nutrient uptake outer membrane protein [Chitinophaga sp.]HEU4554620.1 RagB/SusD family nutrient uptake outer membrane protein [Chitinophaga sp.]
MKLSIQQLIIQQRPQTGARMCCLLLLMAVITCTSCKKWLDVQPQSQVSRDELFSTEDGFKEAINGLYSRCARTDLYGMELLGGFPDVLAQNYSMATDDPVRYRQTALYNYKDVDFISRKDSAWRGLYNVIANANLILENVDKQQSILTPVNYALIKGEALAMRAYCHFDVLRLFAASYAAEPNGKGIPYVTAFSKEVPQQYKTNEALDLMLKDLEAAKTLLATADPIVSAGYKVGYPIPDSSTEQQGDLFVQERRHRLNYYAVCGELARVYLYKGDKAHALSNALEVINANKFPWTRQSDFLNPDDTKKDRILYKELLFGFYIPNTTEDLRRLFHNADRGLYITVQEASTLYETGGVGGEDFRYKQWLSQQATNTTSYMRLEKYTRDPDQNLHPQMAPGIRLSEMYYIAAECTFDTDPAKAWDYFNTVRLNRGIGAPLSNPSKTVFLQELVKEARKEFYGEGQIFYMYKRLNMPITGQNGSTVPASSAVMVLPFPDDEIAYGNR